MLRWDKACANKEMSEYFNSIKSNGVYNAFAKDKNKIIFHPLPQRYIMSRPTREEKNTQGIRDVLAFNMTQV